MKRIMNKIDYDFWWEKIADYAKLVGRTTARPDCNICPYDNLSSS